MRGWGVGGADGPASGCAIAVAGAAWSPEHSVVPTVRDARASVASCVCGWTA